MTALVERVNYNMYFSQIGQDKLVDNFLDFKTNGFFLDVGAHDYRHISNTYFFEKSRNWKGIAIEMDPQFEKGWISNRLNSIFVLENALKIDYGDLLDKHNFPKIIDFLSLDLEPPEVTLQVLFKIFESNIVFNTISFEVDDYRQKETKNKSRDFLKSKGYHFVSELYDRNSTGMIHVDDFWIHSSIIKK